MANLFNASGHPLVDCPFTVTGEVGVPNADLTNPVSVAALARTIAEAAAPHVRDGAAIALPGMTTLSALVLAILHGMVGSFPRIAWAARVDGKFVWKAEYTADLHELRTAQRELGRV